MQGFNLKQSFKAKIILPVILAIAGVVGWANFAQTTAQEREKDIFATMPLYDVTGATKLESRSVSFESPTGERGKGGMAASPLGVGRKGAPMQWVQPGETVTLANIKGQGTIRHIWMTTRTRPTVLRGGTIRVWWDGQKHPSIESPIGDFFGFAHGYTVPYQSAVHSVGPLSGMNIWLPMPFTKSVRMEFTNDSAEALPLFYYIDYTLGDHYDEDVGRLHVLFRRQSPTVIAEDFEFMPARKGKGRFIGAVIGVRPLSEKWWGEGEFKAYIDGDKDFATIVGTGSEDYVGLSYGLQQHPFLYNGASWVENSAGSSQKSTGRISMYRWHILDPVVWTKDIRMVMQQMGCCDLPPGQRSANFKEYMDALYERVDDWSVATFWYEPIPSTPLPPFPSAAARLADLPEPPPPPK